MYCIYLCQFLYIEDDVYIFSSEAVYYAAPGPDTQSKCLLFCIPTFLYLSYSFQFSNAGCLKGNCLKGNCLGNHAMCVSYAVRMSHNLPADSIKIAIAAAILLLILFLLRITTIMMILNETTKLRITFM